MSPGIHSPGGETKKDFGPLAGTVDVRSKLNVMSSNF